MRRVTNRLAIVLLMVVLAISFLPLLPGAVALNLGSLALLRVIFRSSASPTLEAEHWLMAAMTGPSSYGARRNLIRLQLAEGQPAQAVETGRPMLVQGAPDRLSAYWLGQALWDSGDKASARDLWRSDGAIQGELDYLLSECWHWVAQGDLERADASVRQAIDLDPKYGPAYDALASLWWGQRWDAVSWALPQAVQYLPPGTAVWYWSQGRLYILAGDWPRAVVALRASVALAPSEWPMRFLADALGKAGDVAGQAQVQAEIQRRWGQ